MKVTLIAHTNLPEKLVAASAKLCYSASTIDTVMEGLTEEKTANFVDMLAEIGHESPKQKIVNVSNRSIRMCKSITSLLQIVRTRTTN